MENLRERIEAWQQGEDGGVTPWAGLPDHIACARGKVRDSLRQGDDWVMFHSDRLSAFDRAIGLVPYKGVLLATVNRFWWERLHQRFPLAEQTFPHPRVTRCRYHEPLPIEVIVRGYLAGSMQRSYETGGRVFCGQPLPAGLRPYQRLPAPIVTPFTKAREGDRPTTPGELVKERRCTAEEWRQISDIALELFQTGSEIAAERGWILADSKYEFGRDGEGGVRVIDEVHTPDSSRFWRQDSYAAALQEQSRPEAADKDLIRNYLLTQGFSGRGLVPPVPIGEYGRLARVYLDIAESLTGEPLIISGQPWDPQEFVEPLAE